MKKENVVVSKSYEFAKNVVKLSQNLNANRNFVLANQILKSGTSVAANIREGTAAQSRKDFIHKMSISLKEARESAFWIDLLTDTEIIDLKTGSRLNAQFIEIIKILTATLNTAKRNDRSVKQRAPIFIIYDF
jgi:four helix bundle protein